MPLKIIRQDITKLKVDAIVNATNPSFDATGGLDHYIHQQAGNELREEEELDELLSGLTDKQKDYVYSYCMNFNPFVDEPYFDYERFEELDLKNLPTFEEEEEPEIDLPFLVVTHEK